VIMGGTGAKGSGVVGRLFQVGDLDA
jgi:hypothetical protein